MLLIAVCGCIIHSKRCHSDYLLLLFAYVKQYTNIFFELSRNFSKFTNIISVCL